MILLLCLLFGSCSLVQQDLPNEAPVITKSEADTLRVRRGGQIQLRVQATDADDDPLFYTWSAYRADPESGRRVPVGGFVDTTGPSVIWVAPQTIQGSSETFAIQVSVRDRKCGVVADEEERLRCEEEAFQVVDSFSVEVVQHPPRLTAPPDTAVSFREPFFTLEASGLDEDGDPLEYRWSGPPEDSLHWSDDAHSRVTAVPFFPGEYRFRVEVTDGADTAGAWIDVQVYPDPEPPEGGMARLALPGGEEYEIDRYEYPNQRGALPREATWFEAARLCAGEGKRLCTPAEWSAACRGGEERLYSSTDDPEQYSGGSFGLRFCNTGGSAFSGKEDRTAPSGLFANCSGSSGVYDLTGNLREWVGETDESGRWVGGASRSDALLLAPCDSLSALEPLPPAFDLQDPERLEALDRITYGGYFEPLGFRCCRTPR